MPWKLTVRAGPRVERSRYDRLADALDAAEARAKELAGEAPREAIDAKIRRFEPIQQVAARIEVTGPQRVLASVSGGLDVRGDGSTEAYLGRVKRELVEQRKGENAYRALRRALTVRAGGADGPDSAERAGGGRPPDKRKERR
jgi:hypothetical protein